MNITQNINILNLIYQASHTSISEINTQALMSGCSLRMNELLEEHYKVLYLAEKELHSLGQEPAETLPYVSPNVRQVAETFIQAQNKHIKMRQKV